MFAGEVFLSGRTRFLRTSWNGDEARVRIDDDLLFEVGRAGGRMWTSAPATSDWRELSLGPPLLLALALQGVFALHASAVDADGRLVALLGDSGAGKSTLAAASEAGGAGWRRWADDILPLRLTASGIEAVPGFPQLKLPAAEDLPAGTEPRTLAAAVLLADGPELRLERLRSMAATTSWIHHTVAAKLFDSKRLAAHLDFVAEAIRAVPTYRLTAPRDLSLLPRLQEEVRRAGRGC